MKRSGVISAVLLFMCIGIAHATDPQAIVELHWPGRALLGEESQQQVLTRALQVLRSSNFHSGAGDRLHLFNAADIQSSYRKEVAGRFLVVSFPAPRAIVTVGGEIVVGKIVIGLNGEQYATSLFTIDESGVVVGHSKYSGIACVELLQTVRNVAALQ